LNVQVTENNCIFEFDYSKVYWNSKLETEHRRLINLFQPGDVVCDVMAGIGPFAVPAGKKRVFVWANDKNPESFKCLEAAIKKNKVSSLSLSSNFACLPSHQVASFVRPFCEDGRTFIHQAADSVLEASRKGEHAVITHREKPQPKPKDKAAAAAGAEGAAGSRSRHTVREERIPLPSAISHFVMNLPASAIEFLSSYRGVYAGQEDLFAPHTQTKLPLVHVHCFSYKADDETPRIDICERITRELGYPVGAGDDPDVEGQVVIHNVRDVAPAKSMYCASFRLPREVAFAARG
jgi:tRNA (guanine37-N1)-methyltransferase